MTVEYIAMVLAIQTKRGSGPIANLIMLTKNRAVSTRQRIPHCLACGCQPQEKGTKYVLE
jgi:hypothetical protein